VRFISLTEAAREAGMVGGYAEPAETGTTFEENATIKALAYARATGRVCLADDSGLEIDALAGRPGVISSHYATDGRETGLSRAERDAANNARVLHEMEGVPDGQRVARFVCVMVLAGLNHASHTTILSVRGTFEGRIGRTMRGGGGFGYDPLFLVGPEYKISAAELSAVEKNTRSHRGAAARELAAGLRQRGILG
jgi:XTP/dITP diphosphohydrolase